MTDSQPTTDGLEILYNTTWQNSATVTKELGF